MSVEGLAQSVLRRCSPRTHQTFLTHTIHIEMPSYYISHSGCKYIKKKVPRSTEMKPRKRTVNKVRIPSLSDIINEKAESPVVVDVESQFKIFNKLPKGYSMNSTIRTVTYVLQSIMKSEIKSLLQTVQDTENKLKDYDSPQVELDLENLKRSVQRIRAQHENCLLTCSRILTEYPQSSLDNTLMHYYKKSRNVRPEDEPRRSYVQDVDRDCNTTGYKTVAGEPGVTLSNHERAHSERPRQMESHGFV